MRRGEIRHLTCDWVHWKEGRILVPADATFTPKGGQHRSIPLSAGLEKILRDWLGTRRTGLVFPPLPGRPGKGADLRNIFENVRERSGIPFRGWHDLRHHFISWLAHERRPLAEVKEIAGHRQVQTTQRYMHVSPDYLREARAALDGSPFRPGSLPKSLTGGRRRSEKRARR